MYSDSWDAKRSFARIYALGKLVSHGQQCLRAHPSILFCTHTSTWGFEETIWALVSADFHRYLIHIDYIRRRHTLHKRKGCAAHENCMKRRGDVEVVVLETRRDMGSGKLVMHEGYIRACINSIFTMILVTRKLLRG